MCMSEAERTMKEQNFLYSQQACEEKSLILAKDSALSILSCPSGVCTVQIVSSEHLLYLFAPWPHPQPMLSAS